MTLSSTCAYDECEELVDKEHRYCWRHAHNRYGTPPHSRCEQWGEHYNGSRGRRERWRCSHLATVVLRPTVVNHDIYMCEHCAKREVSTGRATRTSPLMENPKCEPLPKSKLLSMQEVRRKLIEALENGQPTNSMLR